MINIRRNVFETNSSSMHSLVITKQSRKYTKEELALNYNPEYYDEFELWRWEDSEDMYYERSPFRILSTPLEKLKYYSAYTLGTWRGKPDKRDIDRIKKFVMKQTGITNPAKIFLYKKPNNWDIEKDKNKNYGTVYNNDTGEDPMHFVERKHIDWEDLILNPKYIIIVDGDEIQNFKDLIEAKIIDTANFEDISSGVDFWNDANKTIYINWLSSNNHWNDKILDEHYIEDFDDKTKTIDFKITAQEDVDTYHKVVDRIKNIIKLAKETKPDIISRFVINNWISDKLDYSSIDTTIFDEVIEEEDTE